MFRRRPYAASDPTFDITLRRADSVFSYGLAEDFRIEVPRRLARRRTIMDGRCEDGQASPWAAGALERQHSASLT